MFSGVTGGAQCPQRLCLRIRKKERHGKKGKGEKLRRKEGKCKREGGKLEMEVGKAIKKRQRTFFFFFFFFAFHF